MQQFAHAWLVLIVDISIKSLLLAGVAGMAVVVLRLRDTNLRHRAWTAVLLGMLAMPALVCVTPAVPLPGWLLPAIPAGATVRQAGDDLLGAAAANPSPESWDAAGRVPQGADFQADAANRSAMNELQSAAAGARQPLDGLDAPKINPIGHGNPTAGHPSTAAEIVGQWPPVLAGLYFSVAGFFVVRLLISLALTYQLIGRARAIHLTTPLPLPRRRGLRLLESASVQIPATVGFVRPVVLLPITWRQWTEFKLQAVLVHELAHVRRGDWLVIALAELNRAIYWFHPVAWIIRRCLAELAERNCDDAVLEADGDRTQYAHYLLEFASSLASTGSRDVPLHGIAMARKLDVETRIDAILDAGRPLARRLVRWALPVCWRSDCRQFCWPPHCSRLTKRATSRSARPARLRSHAGDAWPHSTFRQSGAPRRPRGSGRECLFAARRTPGHRSGGDGPNRRRWRLRVRRRQGLVQCRGDQRAVADRQGVRPGRWFWTGLGAGSQFRSQRQDGQQLALVSQPDRSPRGVGRGRHPAPGRRRRSDRRPHPQHRGAASLRRACA